MRNGLWSLLDMLKIYAHEYVLLGQRLHNLSNYLWIASTRNERDPIDPSDEARAQKELIEKLTEVKELCSKLELSTASLTVAHSLKDLPRNDRELSIIVNVVLDEMRSKLFLFVPPHRAKYHELGSTFTGKMTHEFRNATKELVHGGNCFAVSEYTAAVFHAMRSAELGLRALAAHLKIILPIPLELAEWQTLIDKIESAIRALNSMPKSAAKSDELKFCSSAASQFVYFKDAYRNHVSHSRAIYLESEAESILQRVREFIESLSDVLAE